MEQLSHIGFVSRHLKKLNQCQLYFQIHTLSYISNGHGTYNEKIYYGFHQDELRHATHSWPDQLYPGLKEWQLWKKALGKLSPSDNKSTYLHKLGK